MTSVTRLRAEYRTDQPWVGTSRPRVSWVVETRDPAWRQTAAELRLSDGRTAVVEGDENAFVPWPFADLVPRERVALTVRVRDAAGEWSPRSQPLEIRQGMLGSGEWSARFIGLDEPAFPAQPFTAVRRIEIDRPVAEAILYWSAQGAVVARIDGIPVDDSVLSPGWTSAQLVHETTDVTAMLGIGAHVIALEVTGAWHTEEYGFADGAHRVYGEQPFAAAQLHLRFADGGEDVIGTDASWHAAPVGPVVASGIYAGDVVDARRALEWTPATGEDWPAARIADDQPVPRARTVEPVRRAESLSVREVITTPSGRTVLDFGQNLVGRLRLRVAGPAGTTIVVRHAEVLEHGELCTRPLRRAAATDTFVLSGDGEDALEPVGTFHGFRFAEVEGWPGDLDPSAIEAVVLQSDMRRTGRFHTSHPLVQRLHENVVWSMRGNFLALPTDCPQRDERLGWTGDVQVFAPTAATLYDCDGFLARWLEDLRHEQERSDGIVPTIVPNVFGAGWAAAGWGDAATVVPSVLAERFADRTVLAASLDSMRQWVDAERAASGGSLWESSMQFGDWLDPAAPSDMAGAARTAPGIVATAYRIRSLDLLAAAAADGGHEDLSRRAHVEAEEVRSAFAAAYLTAGGRLVSDAATAYALALRFDIVRDAEMRTALASRLAHVVARDAFHISTGFLGTPLVLDALTDHGFDAEAAALLLQTRAPSWLYPVTMGATTVWERWDSMLPDGTVNPGEMTSFNHYSLGAVVDWLYRRCAGIAPEAPGYRHIRFAPLALPGVADARAEIDTVSGRVVGGWVRDGADVRWSLTVPAHARATVVLAGREPIEVGPGEHEWTMTPVEVPTPPPASLWGPLADVAADPRSYDVVMSVLEAHDPGLADNVRRRTDWTLRTPLGAALFAVPGDVVGAIAAGLDELRSATTAP